MAPEMTYEPQSYNDKSALSNGWHPAYLLAITDEPTPESWKMYKASPRMWRWHFCVWEIPTLIDRQAPERQSAPSSQKFTPKGTQPASKAYSWTSTLLQRQIPPGERVNLDPLMPFPCRVKIERNNDYANIVDVEAWTEGMQYLTPELKMQLASFLTDQRPAPQPQQVPPPVPAPPAPPQPGMTTWGGGTAQPAAAGSKPNF